MIWLYNKKKAEVLLHRWYTHGYIKFWEKFYKILVCCWRNVTSHCMFTLVSLTETNLKQHLVQSQLLEVRSHIFVIVSDRMWSSVAEWAWLYQSWCGWYDVNITALWLIKYEYISVIEHSISLGSIKYYN